MRHLSALLLVPALLAFPLTTITRAADPAPAELTALDQQFQQLKQERVTAVYDADLAKLNASYLGGIAKKIETEKAAGHLDDVLALQAEQKLISDHTPMPEQDDAATPEAVKALRSIYRAAVAKLATARDANLKALIEPLNTRLQTLETTLTKADRIADAKAVRAYREGLASPAAPATAASTPSTAAPTAPAGEVKPFPLAQATAMKDGYTNSLGMKFLYIKEAQLLVCIHETRYKDYAAFAAVTKKVDSKWKETEQEGVAIKERADEHPVSNVSEGDAERFCEWLSQKDGLHCRLPTDAEWSAFTGIARKERRRADTTPDTVLHVAGEYAWGTRFPPPKGVANLSDESRKKAPDLQKGAVLLAGYDDGWPTTAPVMSFPPMKNGLYDIAGNVGEWVSDFYNASQKARVLRGCGWRNGTSETDCALSYRREAELDRRRPDLGFRVVIEVK